MERRKTLRRLVRGLAYINFEPYNTGGVITELSAFGLRFHTVEPLQQGGILRLSLVFAGMDYFEVVGEVVWTDSTRKIGGVRFLVLPAGAADQISSWLENSASANRIRTATTPETVPATEPGALISTASPVRPAKTLISDQKLSDRPTGSALAPHGWESKPSTMLLTTLLDSDPPRRRSPAAAVIVCLILVPMVWFGVRRYNWLSSWILRTNPISNPFAAAPMRTLMGGILPGLDVSNSRETNSEAENPAQAMSLNTANPAQTPEQAQPDVPKSNSQAGNPKTVAETESPESPAAESRLPPNADAAAPGAVEMPQSLLEANRPLVTASRNFVFPTSRDVAQIPVPVKPQPADIPGESELILAWQYLEGQGGRPLDPVAASHLLWTAVKKGNVTAETTLATLYLRGEGLPKSCDQARVLLSAASDRGSTEAKHKLRELNQTGCH